MILVFDRDAEGAARAAHELRAEGANATPQAVDVTVEEAVRGAVHGAVSVHGRIDVLVNNAGIYPHTPFEELTFRGVAPRARHEPRLASSSARTPSIPP